MWGDGGVMFFPRSAQGSVGRGRGAVLGALQRELWVESCSAKPGPLGLC